MAWNAVLHAKQRNLPPESHVPRFSFESLKVEQSNPTGPGTISLELESIPPPKITWFRNRNLVREKTGRHRMKFKEIAPNRFLALLEIDCFSNSDAGMYSCMAANGFGSTRFNVKVAGEPDWSKPIVLKAPNIEYLGDCRYRMTVTVWSTKKQRIFWRKFKRGREVRLDTAAKKKNSDETRIEISANEVRKHIYDIAMEIHEATRSDRGVYRCDILDAYGELQCEFPLNCEKGTPEGRPELVTDPKIVQLKTQSVVMAFCVKSPQVLQYSWILPNGRVVPADDLDRKIMKFEAERLFAKENSEYYHGRLTLNHWFSSPKGFYTCLIRNSFGCLVIKFNLSVSPDLMAPTPSWR